MHKADLLAVSLLALVASGQIRPGTSLPSERHLASAAGVSRVSVRAASAWLRAEGYIAVSQGAATCVSSSDHPAIKQLLSGQRQDLQDLAEVLALIVPWVARRAAALRSDPDMSSVVTPFGFIKCLAAASGSALVSQILCSLERPLRLLLANRVPFPGRGGPISGAEMISAIRAAIAAGQADEAEAAAYRYAGAILVASGSDAGVPLREENIFDTLSALRDVSLVDRIEQTLLTMLNEHRLTPGMRLPSERDLSDQFGVSRASVRSALLRLRRCGKLEVSDRTATAVSPTIARSADVLLPHERLGELCEIRSFMEGWVVRRACMNKDRDGEPMLRRVLAETTRSGRSERHKAADDMAFHAAISRVSGSALHMVLLERSADILLDYFDYSRLTLLPGQARDAEVIAHHTGIAHHVVRGEPELATTYMAEHSRTFSNAFRVMSE